MKMRLNFIRALINNPGILFLDEPTSGLDPRNARKIKDIILERKNQGCTIFLTTHNMSDADELCDRLAFIVDGELPVVDTPHSLKLQHGKKTVRIEYMSDTGSRIAEFDIDSLSGNEEFRRILECEKVETIHTTEATLESIFIDITGKKLQ